MKPRDHARYKAGVHFHPRSNSGPQSARIRCREDYAADLRRRAEYEQHVSMKPGHPFKWNRNDGKREQVVAQGRAHDPYYFYKMKPEHQAGMAAACIVVALFAVLILCIGWGAACGISHSTTAICQ